MSLRHFLKFTGLGRVVMIPFRFLFIALPCCCCQVAAMLRWAFSSKEHYNHTYDLTELNLQYLASYVAVVSGHKVSEIQGYMQELEKMVDCGRCSASAPWPVPTDTTPTSNRVTADALAGMRSCGRPNRELSLRREWIADWALLLSPLR